MGHVHLQVSDVEATVRFYVDEVGLDLTARMGAEAAFFSSNGYHHHIGANTWRSRGGAPAPRESAGLERIAFAVEGVERVEALRLRLQGRGRAVSGGKGTVVVRDPDGIELWFVA
jgi:catechol 2,3-dioxygenase